MKGQNASGFSCCIFQAKFFEFGLKNATRKLACNFNLKSTAKFSFLHLYIFPGHSMEFNFVLQVHDTDHHRRELDVSRFSISALSWRYSFLIFP